MSRFTYCTVLLLSLLSLLSAVPVGHFQLKHSLPDGGTAHVPAGIVAMSPQLMHLQSTIDQIQQNKPVAIFVMMDQTGSMMGRDPQGSRYEALSAILDGIYAHSPQSEIGGVFFGEDTWLDCNDESLFAELLPSDLVLSNAHKHRRGYIPLVTMNKQYLSTHYGTKSGVDLFRNFWQQKRSLSSADSLTLGLTAFSYSMSPAFYPHHHMEWSYMKGPGKGNNNMNFGSSEDGYAHAFEMARQAFSRTAIPKEDQFIIFISDGDINLTYLEKYRTRPTNPYTTDLYKLPTLFTLFYTDAGGTSTTLKLQTLRDSIRVNSYSPTVTKSDIWRVKSGVEALEKVNTHILSVITADRVISPSQVTINGIHSIVGDSSRMGSWIPLKHSPDTLTETIHFKTMINGIPTDSTQTSTRTFSVETGHSTYNTDTINLAWWDRDILITSATGAPLSTILLGDNRLRVAFTQDPQTAGYTYSSATLTLETSQGDRETLTLTAANGFSQELTFGRNSTTLENGVLDFAAGAGTLKVLFRNPELPLDTLERSIPADIAIPAASLYLNGQIQSSSLNAALNTKRHFTTDSLPVAIEARRADGSLITSGVTITFGQHNAIPSTSYTGGFTLTSGDTIRAIATIAGYDAPAEAWWIYEQNLPDTQVTAILTAEPSKLPDFRFGHSLHINLLSNADTIRYTRDGTLPTEQSTLFVPGHDTITITDQDNDTVLIRGIAYGTNFKPVLSEWRYVRDTLPSLIATPPSTKFSDTLSIALMVVGGAQDAWSNSRIFYTLDGADPDTNSMLYTGAIIVDTTVILKARIFADNRIASPILMERYTLTAGVASGWYLDRSGDGAIDEAVLLMTKEIHSVPSTVTLSSPYDTRELRVITSSSDLILEAPHKLRIVLSEPFAFTGSTTFPTAVYGRLDGPEYGDSTPLTIADSVAPVLVQADYFIGKTLSSTPVFSRDLDTLTVEFSEPVSLAGITEPFQLAHRGLPYRLMVTPQGTTTQQTVRYLVDTVIGVDSPKQGDSIHINSTARVSALGVTQDNPDNRWVELIVHQPPFNLTIMALTPANPSTYRIPSNLSSSAFREETGVLIIADFHTTLWEAEKLTSTIEIFDPLGHTMASQREQQSAGPLVIERKEENSTRLIYYWNGTNLQGRRVSSGSYLAVITLTTPAGERITKRITLGIQQ